MELSQSNVATNHKILTTGNEVQEECSICYEPFTNKAFISDCLHNFCHHCICTWIQLRATCPLCLQPVTSLIKNVRSLDDYDIEHVFPPHPDIFGSYLRDIDMPDGLLEYESSLDDSMSIVSDLDLLDYGGNEDELTGSNDDLQSVPHSLEESLSNSSVNLSVNVDDDDYCSDEDDELTDGSLSENQDSCEDEEDDKDDDDDESDENHSENEESCEESDDEDQYYDGNNNEDDGDDDSDTDNYEDNLSFSDTYDDDDDDDDNNSYQWNLVSNYFLSPECAYGLGHVVPKWNDIEDSDSDGDYSSPSNTASLVYSSNYY